jgi:hypothetical protein
MAGIDFTLLRRQVELAPVLDLVGFEATTRCGPQLRGPCPLHAATALAAAPRRRRSRSFAAQVTKNCWHCFACGASGNALDLYLAVTKLPVYAGALELCARLGLVVPRLGPPVSGRGTGRRQCLPHGQRSPP